MTTRTNLRPEDLQPIIDLQGRSYAAEQGWNASFKVHVALPLAQFLAAPSPRSRFWILEDGPIIGSIAVVGSGRPC